MASAPSQDGLRTFGIVWLAQSLSVVASGMTGFALNVYPAQVLRGPWGHWGPSLRGSAV
jgi:hypothetical protein